VVSQIPFLYGKFKFNIAGQNGDCKSCGCGFALTDFHCDISLSTLVVLIIQAGVERMLEDKLLIFRLKRADEQALRQIYEKYKDTLLTVAVLLLQDKNKAEDILHDVFVSFAEDVRQLHLYGRLKGYLVSCLVSRARDIYREKMYRVVGLDSTGPIRAETGGSAKVVIGDEEMRPLADGLAQLPFQQREVIILRLQGGMGFRQIAELQGVSVSTVRGRCRYGLDRLQAILDGEPAE
jgi:RNA polymerase sigma-70 factor (ECF subfamily)